MPDKPTERETKNTVFSHENAPQQPSSQNVKKSNLPPRQASSNPLAELGIDIPVETVPLPSLGKTYPQGSALQYKETVAIKSMTAKEEDILTSRALIKDGTVITKLLQSCIVDKSVDVPNMLMGDINAVMVAIRCTGYTTKYDTSITCPHCNTISKQEFDLGQLPLKRLNLEPDEAGTNIFSITLPKTKAHVQFKFLTGRDTEELQVLDERKKKLGYKVDNLVTARLQHSILSVNGKTDKTLLSKFIQHMPAIDSLTLRTYVDDNEPGIDMSAVVECSNVDCGAVEEVSIPLGVNFFWPSAGK
jgi:hypothetical protein